MGMGAQDYQDLQRSKTPWRRKTLGVAFGIAVGLLIFDTQNSLIRDTVQRVTGSPMQSAPYADRIGHLIEKNVKSALDSITPYIK